MAKLEECVRSVQMDGLLWGASKLVPVGYGIKKLQISCVVEDDKVGTDILEEEITKFEDYVSNNHRGVEPCFNLHLCNSCHNAAGREFYMPVFRLEMVPSFHQTNIVSPKMLTSFVIRLSIYR